MRFCCWSIIELRWSMRRAENRSRGVIAENDHLSFSKGAGIWARRSSLRRRQARFSRFTLNSGNDSGWSLKLKLKKKIMCPTMRIKTKLKAALLQRHLLSFIYLFYPRPSGFFLKTTFACYLQKFMLFWRPKSLRTPGHQSPKSLEAYEPLCSIENPHLFK